MVCVFRCWCATLFAFLLTAPAVCAADESLARYLPAGAVGTLEGRGWSEVVTRLEQSELVKAILASPNYKDFIDSPQGRKVRGGIAVAQVQYGKDLWSMTRDLIGDRWIVGVYAPESGDKPVVLGLIRTESPEIAAHIRTRLEPLVQLTADKVKTEDSDGGGLRLVNVDGSAMILQDRWIAVSNQRSLVDQVEAALRSDAGGNLAASEAWKKARHSDRGETKLEAWADYDRIRELLQQDRLLPDKLDNPLASLLLGGVVEYVSHADFLTATLDLGESSWGLEAFVPGKPAEIDAAHQTLLPPVPTDLQTRLGPQVASISIVRDWAAWYGQRESLMIEQILPEFDKFETGLATFMPGKDFRADVLPLFSKRLQIISAPQSFAHLEGRPGVQLPGTAIIVELEQPEQASDLLQMVFQTITAVVNLQAGQEKRIPWVMSSETYKDVQLSYAKYLQTPKGADLPIAFNFQPSAARVGRHFVMATSQDLCRQLIDALQNPSGDAKSAAADRPDWSFEVAPAVVADLLESNRAIIEAKAVQDGKSADQATNGLNDALNLLRRLRPVSLSSTLQPDGYVWRFQGGW